MKHKGFSIVEMCVAMAIMAVLGVGVSGLLTTSTLAQINTQVQQSCEYVASNIVDRLRFELRFARDVSVINGGQALNFSTTNPNTNITYTFQNNTVLRINNTNNTTINMIDNYYRDANHPLIAFCNGPCFTQTALGPTATAQVTLNNLVVRDNAATGTALDNATRFVNNGQDFSRVQFRVQEVTFNILSGQQFQ